MDKKASIRQVVLYSVMNYIGTAIGIFSVLFIYPLNNEFAGIVRHIDNIAQFLYPIMVLGASHALIKFYPSLSQQNRLQLFNYSVYSISLISLGIFAMLAVFKNISDYAHKDLLYYAFPIAVALAFIELFKKQAQDLQRIAIPALFEKVIPKIVLPLIFILLVNQVVGTVPSLYIYTGCYLLIFALTALYLLAHFKPGFNYRFNALFGEISKRDYFRYSLYSFAGSLGSILAFRLDGLLIPQFFTMADNGIFGYGVTLSAALQIPAVGLFALYAPIISGYLQSENYKELALKYKDVARLLLFTGALLYSCILLGLEDLFLMLPTYEKLKGAIPIIKILGFSVVVNMATGFNSEIITYSKYYRFNLITVILLIIFNLSFTLYSVYYTSLGLAGIAWASFISMALFNIAKLAFIYKKFRIHPFSADYAKLVLVFTATASVLYLLPDTKWNAINLLYKSGLCLLINISVIYKLQLVPQLNEWVAVALAKIRK